MGYVLNFPNGKVAYCATLAVHPDYQKGKVNYLLLRAMLGKLVLEEMVECRFLVEPDNRDARSVHNALGARVVREVDDYYQRGDRRGWAGLQFVDRKDPVHRAATLLDLIRHWRTGAPFDGGNIPTCPFSIEEALSVVQETVTKWIGLGARTLMLGGDHLMTLGALRAPPFESEELAYLADAGVCVWTPWDLRDGRLAAQLQGDIARVARGPAYVSLDLDVLDPSFCPTVAEPVPGGLSVVEMIALVRRPGPLASGPDPGRAASGPHRRSAGDHSGKHLGTRGLPRRHGRALAHRSTVGKTQGHRGL